MKKSYSAGLVFCLVLLSAMSYCWWDNDSLSTKRPSFKAVKILTPAKTLTEGGKDRGRSEERRSGESRKRQDVKRPASFAGAELVSAVKSADDFQNILNNANLTTTITIAKATQLLRSEEPLRIAGYFTNALEDIGQKDNDQRERLVFIANELQSDQLLPFWQDIVARQPARFDDETKYLRFGEPTEELHSIHLELLDSIRNIGLIASRDASASQFLMNLILHPTSPLHDDFIRERAFISLKEANLSASIRVLKSLAPDDSLRARLIRP